MKGKNQKNLLRLHHVGIDTYKHAIIYMRKDCIICHAEGFEAQARVRVRLNGREIVATLNIVSSDVLHPGEAGLSEYAWGLLDAREGDMISVSHAPPLRSLSAVRSKIFDHELNKNDFTQIIEDIIHGRYSDIHTSAFLTATAGGRLNEKEIEYLTETMVELGDHLSWDSKLVVDKHCVGGLPGNRTSIIVVPIVASFGLLIPKTSSRAITSPAGTADTMEVLAPVELDIDKMRNVVEQENGCIVWGGAASLSPADDILIRVERSLNLDSEGQLVASVLSKKIAAGSTHVVIDIPIGPTAKIRDKKSANLLVHYLSAIAKRCGLHITTILSDGSQPVGRGIGPALEARDVLAVLQNKKDAPQDLRERALTLAAAVLEFSPDVKKGEGITIATKILDSGKAWDKFQGICDAQGGMHAPSAAAYTHTITSKKKAEIYNINNRLLAEIARLAGAPQAKTSGIDLHVRLGDKVSADEPLYTIHAESRGEMEYALAMLSEERPIIELVEV